MREAGRGIGYLMLFVVVFVAFNAANWLLHKWLGVGYILLAEPNL